MPKPTLRASLVLGVVLAGLFAACAPQEKPAPADLVLKNGVIYTVDSQSTLARAVAIRDGVFVHVGDDKGAEAFIGEKTKVTDLQGKLALPGFIDAHAHLISAYKIYDQVNLYGLKTKEEIQGAIREYRKAHPDAKAVKGRGWRNTEFPGRGPDKRILDAVLPDVPASFSSEDGHSIWVNSKALALAKITRATRNPEGGIIERDPATGEPSGTLRENAADLAADIFPPPSVEQMMRGLEGYQKMALGFGITTAHDSSLDAGSDEITAYHNLLNAGRLGMRVRASLYVDPNKGVAQVAGLIKERERNKGDLFQTNAAKLFLDGVVEGGTAYLKEPYLHRPGWRGEPLWKADVLDQVCAELDRNGFQIHVHSIGDAATAMTLDALDFARKANGPRDSRAMITHLQLVAPADIFRFKELGVVAAAQPYWFAKDDYYYNLQVPYLGQTRADAEYPMKSFFDAGVVVASSSDFPVTIPCNPLVAIQIGMTRRKLGVDDPKEALWPAEAVTLEQMIRSFTINGAYANFLEKETGSIEVGKSADLIVLDRNLFQIPASEISQAKVVMTLFKGK